MKFHWENLTEEERKEVLKHGDPGRIAELDDEYLCHYCCEDTDSTYLLYSEILKPALDKFPELEEFHSKYFSSLVQHCVVQQLLGVQLDVEQLTEHESLLRKQLQEAEATLLKHPKIKDGIEEFHRLMLEEFEKTEPLDKFRKVKETTEPVKFSKGGKLLASWVRWNQKRELEAMQPPEYNRTWIKWWEQRCSLAESIREYSCTSVEKNSDIGLFNIYSNDHRRWMLYDFFRNPVLVLTDNEKPSTSGTALDGFGEVGALFSKTDDLRKELQFCNSLRNASDMKTGIYHPRLKVPGTLTGRLSGDGGFNFQNTPKSRGFLEVFGPRTGDVLLDWDATALEPTVLAECSRDPGLLSVYGPNANKAQDIYIYVGSALPGIKDVFLGAGYDPVNPDKEVMGRIKKEHKELRNLCKVLKLSADYGAGPGKWFSTLKLKGYNYTIEQCREFHVAFWKLFQKIKEHESQLQAQWEKNGGWLLDALGLPFCVAAEYKKDVINRKIQRSGHEILMLYQCIVSEELLARGIPYRPWCWDYHDELIIEIPEEHTEEANEVLGKICFDKLNHLLHNGTGGFETCVKLKGSGGQIQTLANAKLEG